MPSPFSCPRSQPCFDHPCVNLVLLSGAPSLPLPSTRVEAALRQAAAGAALVWVTHDDQQPSRVGGKVLTLPAGVYVCMLQANLLCYVVLGARGASLNCWWAVC